MFSNSTNYRIMAAENENCRLCGIKSDSVIEIFGRNGLKLSVESILTKHFNFKLSDDEPFSKIVCKKCWRITEQFHKLYCNVEKYTAELKSLLESQTDIRGQSSEEIKKEECVDYDLLSATENANDCTSYDSSEQIKRVKIESTVEENDISITTFDYDDLDTANKRKSSMARKKKKSISTECLTESKDKIKSDVRNKMKRDQSIESDQTKRIKEMDQVINETLGIICELCDINTGNFTNLMKHYRNEHNSEGSITCCDRKFTKRHTLYNHVQNHRCPDRFKCNLCGKKFIDKSYLNRHIKNHDPSSKTFQCTECPKRYDYQKLLDIHYTQSHNVGPKPYICDLCDKGFCTKYTIAAHILTMHTERTTFICDTCAKVFKSRLQLDIHYKKNHMGVVTPKFQCTICNAWLSSRRGLKYHINRLHEATEVTCTICGKVCPYKDALISHMKFVHSKRSFPCSMCEKTFKSPLSLKEHISTHTGFNLYKCVYCGMEFKSNANMYKHRKNAHPIEWQEDREKRLNVKMPQPQQLPGTFRSTSYI